MTRSSTSYSYDVDDASYFTGEGTHLASIAEKKRLWWRNATINTLFIGSWFSFATVLSVYNKWMFSAEHFGFPFPLFVTTMHMFVQFVLATLIRNIWPKRFRPQNTPSRSDYVKKACPTGVASSLDIGLSNFSLKTITLSFYTMCKSSSLIFVLLFAFLFHLERFSWRLVAVIFLIFSGVLLMVATETKFVLEGLILVLSASAFGGLRWSLTQVLLQNKEMGLDNPAATVFWLAPVMGITLALLSAVVEHWGVVFSSHFFLTFDKVLETIFFITAPGVLAFCMIMSEFYIIQRTGVVPMSIAGIAKEVTTITVSAWFFGDELTPLNITGVSITICGIILFTYHKYRRSIESAVPLDGHGNPISTVDGIHDAIDEQLGEFVELGETVHLTSESRVSYDFEENGTAKSNLSTPFSAASIEGDLNDPELHSFPSSKTRRGAVNHGSGYGPVAHEVTLAVARESIEIPKVWTRDNL